MTGPHDAIGYRDVDLRIAAAIELELVNEIPQDAISWREVKTAEHVRYLVASR